MAFNKKADDASDQQKDSLTEPRSDLATLDATYFSLFLHLVECGSVTEAARRSRIGQSAASARLAALTRAIGKPLYFRDGKRNALTPTGRKLALHAEKIVKVVDLAAQEMQPLRKSDTTLRVAYVPSLSRDLLVPAVIQLRTKYPDVEVHALQGRSQDVLKRVAEQDADVGLGFYEGGYSSDVRADLLFERPLSLVMRIKNPLFKVKQISLDNLKGQPMALAAADLKAGQLVHEFLSDNHFVPRIAFQADSINAVLSYVRATNSVGLIPEPYDSDAEGLRAVGLSPSPPKIKVHVFVPRPRGPRTSVAGFVEEVKKIARSHRW